ncbi:MAG TPA: PDZ domain-containing protein [Candidatus Sulfotelmatobacter sp.]
MKRNTALLAVVGRITLSFLCCGQALGLVVPASSDATAPESSEPARPVSYTISLSEPAQHLLHIHLNVPPGNAVQELQLPVWNALYQVRDFAQYLNWIRATSPSGSALPLRELDQSRWQLSGAGAGAVVDYEIFADNAGPFNAQLNPHHGFLNLAQVLMYPVDDRARAATVEFRDLPEAWHIAIPLTVVSTSKYRAENYDRLVDSPVEIGTFQESDFDESGGHYRVIVDGDPSDYDMSKIVVDLRKIVAAAITWMNDRPFDGYMFIYHFPRGPAGGGMEHSFSTAIDLNADALKNNSEALRGVTAHEFFHLWNVKRIRPQTLEPVDFTKENYTRALWFSEGCTSTAEGIIELRAGLIDERQYLDHLGEEITELERRPAHLTQSAEESSLDAWLEGNAYYRRPERSISYYNKGELLGVILDLQLREASHGQASLRELFQWMNQNFAKQGRYFDDADGVRGAAEMVSHSDFSSFFAKYVSGTEEIPWNDFFSSIGLRVMEQATTLPDNGFTASRNFDGPLSVGSVLAGGDAEREGLQVGDAILEIQGKPASQQSRDELTQLKLGETLILKIRTRRGVERELKWKVGSRSQVSYEIRDLETVTAAQRARRTAWLKGEAQSDAESLNSGLNKTGLNQK